MPQFGNSGDKIGQAVAGSPAIPFRGAQRDVDCEESLMSSIERFQNVVLGSGEAGKYIAWELARGGQRVAVVERGLIGGSCPNIACRSKEVIHSADLWSSFAGWDIRTAPWPVDWTWPAYATQA